MTRFLPLILPIVFLLAACAASIPSERLKIEQPVIETRTIPLIEVDGLQFRDLDRDGKLTPFEDWRLAPAARASDLLSRMTVREKIGQMVVADLSGDAPYGQPSNAYAMDAAGKLLASGITQFNSRLSTDAVHLAAANNAVQAVAENGRLGIPALMMTDPRHGTTELVGATIAGGNFSVWPNNLGFAALGDPAVTAEYASLVRRDLRATGFALLLGPQIDLATEPRWPRAYDTFGENPKLAARMSAAFVTGLQGSPGGIAPGGVAATIKHFAGYAASANGFDAHNRYGRISVVDSKEFEQQLRPFEGALQVHPSTVMPTYSILSGLVLDGHEVEQVGTGFSKDILTGVLRRRLGFDGVVLSDWAITNDCEAVCRDGYPAGQRPSFAGISMAWGVENLTRAERFAKAINAGMDEFGGVDDPAPIAEGLSQGLISQAQVDVSVGRILKRAFELGIFEAPFVDQDQAAAAVGTREQIARARTVQAQSMVLLKRAAAIEIAAGTPVALYGMAPDAARAAGLVPVADPTSAQVAIVRVRSPSQILHPGFMFGSMQQEGSLAFPADDPALRFVDGLPKSVKVVIDVQLDRPAIVSPLVERADVLLASFGSGDAALLDVLTGKTRPVGRLPIELPSSMAAVEQQRPGAPADSEDPIYPLGYGPRD